jgi:hypothetical protein
MFILTKIFTDLLSLLQSEGVLVANRRSLLEREGLLSIVHEILERLEAHLVADQYYRVTCNVRTADPDAFAAAMHEKGLGGMEGPTISKVCFMHSPLCPSCHVLESPPFPNHFGRLVVTFHYASMFCCPYTPPSSEF